MIKNVLAAFASGVTIFNYFLWSWVNPDRFPEIKKSKGCRAFCNSMSWCGVAIIPRWWFLKVIGWWMPKPVVFNVKNQDVDVRQLKKLFGREDDPKFYRDMTSASGQNMLKAGRHFFLLPGQGTPTEYDGSTAGKMDRALLDNDKKYIRYDDIFVEKHWASEMAK